jgi:hypothetical protein
LEDVADLLPAIAAPPARAKKNGREPKPAGNLTRGNRLGDQARSKDRARTPRAGLDLLSDPDRPEVRPGPDPSEFEALRAECDRLREEVQGLRSRLGDRSDVVEERCDQLTRERDAARAERDTLAREWQESRGRSEAERDALAREVEQLQDRLDALERSRAEADSRYDAERGHWEHERRDWEAKCERSQGQLVEAERQLAEHRDQLAAEREGASRLGEAHARVTAERDGLAGDVERLRDDLGKVGRSRAEAAAEFDAARARWQGERLELHSRWDRERDELLSGSEQRLTEQHGRFEAERRIWDEQSEEHARLAGEWEALAREVDQVQAELIEGREALGREVKRLKEELAASERARGEAESERDAVRGAWEAERGELRSRWEKERDELLVAAALAAERERTAERERLTDERDARARDAAHLRERLDALERSRAGGESDDYATARARWEDERRELEADRDRERRELLAEAERRLQAERDAGRAAAEVVDRQLKSLREVVGRELESLREQTRALQGALDDARRERDAAVGRAEQSALERDRLHAGLDQGDEAHRESERAWRADAERLAGALEQARREAANAARLAAGQADSVRVLRAEVDHLRRERESLGETHRRELAAQQHEWEAERGRWFELIAAARPESPAEEGPASAVEDPSAAADPTPDHARRSRSPGVVQPLPPRPQASSYDDPDAFRADLEHWVAAARERIRATPTNGARSRSDAYTRWLEYELRAAGDELDWSQRVRRRGREDQLTEPAAG